MLSNASRFRCCRAVLVVSSWINLGSQDRHRLSRHGWAGTSRELGPGFESESSVACHQERDKEAVSMA